MSTMKRVALVAAILASGHIVVAQADWQRVSNEPGRFSVMVPGVLSADAPATDAGGITTHSFSAREQARVYLIVYADGSATSPRKEMDDARDAFLKSVIGSLGSQHYFKSTQPVGDTMATEFTARIPAHQAEVKARILWHNSRLYMIGVVTLPGAGSALDVDKFLDSFRITS